ncbi:MAG: pectate lyase [Akkermansiaceae bacterium]|jgi:pectate lyase|nr:pectate lyase [Akkermansiaceae bacterium]
MKIFRPSILQGSLWLLMSAPLAWADAWSCLKKPDRWFRSEEGRETIERVLSWQAETGAWPKNEDTTRKIYEGNRRKLEGTFDNKATTGELRLLARDWEITADEKSRDAFLKGFDHIIEAQYPHGGWPQYYPPGKGYHRHVTFNDGTMVRLLELLRDSAEWDWLDHKRKNAAAKAVEKGIDCILRCQIEIDGRKTVWCAQHDAESLEPVLARSYELPSLSGAESAGILRFLMTLPDPNKNIRDAIEAGVEWFEKSKIEGFRYERREGRIVADDSAGPLWARFYDIESGRPMFCDRDGVKVFDLAKVGKERRLGYAWYGDWGEEVEKDHRRWRSKVR